MSRLNRVFDAVRQENLDALLITTPVNTYYISGFRAVAYTRPIFVLVCEEPVLVVPELEMDHALKHANIGRVEQYSDEDFEGGKNLSPLVAALNKTLAVMKDCGLQQCRLGFEPGAVSYAAYCQLDELFAGTLNGISPVIEYMRRCKEPREIKLIKTGCELADYGMAVEIEKTVPGTTELELMMDAMTAMINEGIARYPDYVLDSGARPITGLKTVLPHSIPSANTVKLGDVVIHGTGCLCEGYHSENERTLVVGKPTGDQRKFFHLMVESQKRAFDTIKPGVCCSDVDLAARRVVEKAGYSQFFLHRTGHSMGLGIHETPFFAPTDETILEAGMIMTVEPGIYVPQLGGFRHSDTILITEDGFDFLTNTPRDLAALTV